MEKEQPGQMGDAPAGTDMPAEAGTSPAMGKARNMKYLAQSGTQKTHPAKPSQPNVMRYLD